MPPYGETDETMLSIETDPLDKTYGIKVPQVMKDALDKLGRVPKRQLNDKLLLVIDNFLTAAEYVPGKFLKTNES